MQRKLLLLLIFMLGSLPAACAPSAPVAGETRNIFLTAADGTPLVSTLYLPQQLPAPAVLLLHVAGGSRRDWDLHAKLLRSAGYVALALDFRGHGGSGGTADYPRMTDDAAAAFAYLSQQPFVPADRITLIGGSLGANVALAYAARQPHVRGVALLSAGLGNYGYLAAPDAARYGARPLLLLAGEGDAYAAASLRELSGITGSAQSLLLPTAIHGTALLSEQDAWETLLRWLRRIME